MIKKLHLLSIAAIAPFAIFAQSAGDLDTSFGIGGKVENNVALASFVATSQVVQPDGKILVGGNLIDGFQARSFISRYNTNGSIDTSFNGNGMVILDFLTGVIDMELQSDGKIVAAGNRVGFPALARLNANGTFDTDFETDGLTDPGYIGNAKDIIIQPDGKILFLTEFHTGASQDYRIARFNPNGSQDSGFGSGGYYINDDFGFYEFTQGIALQSDGKILVGGSYNNAGVGSVFVARYNANGTLDSTFNGTGKRTIAGNASFSREFSAIAIQTDEKIILTTKSYGVGTFMNVYRLNANGTNDTSFDTDGVTNNSVTYVNSGRPGKVKIQADGRIVVLETLVTNSTYNVMMLRYTTGGALDTTFNTDGMMEMNFLNSNDYPVDFDVVGTTLVLTHNTLETIYQTRVALSKIASNGFPENSFDNDGTKVTTHDGYGIPTTDYTETSLLQPDGKILVAGSSAFWDNEYFTICRYNPDGTLDNLFGVGGRLTLPYDGHINAMGLQSDGKIVITGQTTVFPPIIRINPTGILDTTFGDGGITYFYDGFGSGEAIVIAPDGKILISGHTYSNETGEYSTNFRIVKLTANGGFDNTFSGDGISITGSTNDGEGFRCLKLQPDGKILAAGFYNVAGGLNKPIICRFNSNGAFDTTFNSTGKVIINETGQNVANAIEIQQDGKILVMYGRDGVDSTKLIRLNTNGTPDATFAGTGTAVAATTDYVPSMTISPDQKIIVIGLDSSLDFVVQRFKTDGTPDTDFGTNGIVETDFNGMWDTAISCVVTADNKLVVSGQSNFSEESWYGGGNQTLAKYHLNDVLGNNEFELSAQSFYPNPAVNTINFATEINSAEIFTIDGKRMSVNQVGQSIDVSSLKKGVYIVKWKSQNGKTMQSKLVKQ